MNVFLPKHISPQASPICSMQRVTCGSSASSPQDYLRTSRGREDDLLLSPGQLFVTCTKEKKDY